MDGRRRDVSYDYGVSAQPVVFAAWRGRCSIPIRNIDIYLNAHLSNKARMKVSEVASMMPESLCLKMFPRLDVWPSIFKRSPPTEHSIELFFFSEERDEKVLDNLLTDAMRNNLALKAMLGEAELLIFPSLQLPYKLQTFQGKFYFWGFFRQQQHTFSHESDYDVSMENTEEKHSLPLNSDNHMSFEGKEILKRNTTGHNPCVGNLRNANVQEVVEKHPGCKRPLRVRQNHLQTHIASKRQRPSSSSSSYDKYRFVSDEAAKRYKETYSKKSIILERGFAGILDDTISAHGWHELVSHPPEAVIPVVREFYANAKERKGSKVFVRGKWISFDRNTINKLYNISQASDEEYVNLCRGSVDPKEIIRVIAYPGTQWKSSKVDVLNFPQSGLLPESNAWHYFISAKILPSNHLGDVSKERAILNYAINLRIPVDVGRIIERNIEHILEGSTTRGLAYPSLITTLCLKAGVKVLDNEERRKSIDAINAATLARYKSPMIGRPLLDYEARPSAPAPDNEPCEALGFSALQHQLSKLRQSVADMRAYQQQFFDYQVKFNTALAESLSLRPVTTFPTPPPRFSRAPASHNPPPKDEEA